MAAALDLTDECWTEADAADQVRVGDLYDGAPLPSLEDEFALFYWEDQRRVFLPVRFSFALVVRSFSAFVVLVPVTTSADVPDPEKFEFLLDQGRTAKDFVR